jgi:DNA-binding transcriptional ArsR family regulator
MKKEKQFPTIGTRVPMNDEIEELEQQFGQIASLIGERSRAIMLWNLLDGKAYTATELALSAHISPQAASHHLSKLVEAGLLALVRQGRHRYYCFANERVAHVIENLAGLLPLPTKAPKQATIVPSGLTYARSCYGHLAGKVGVTIHNALLTKGLFFPEKGEYGISEKGRAWFLDLEMDVMAIESRKRKLAYPCMDWSERKFHLGGALGTLLLTTLLERDWVRKMDGSREIVMTSNGKKELFGLLGLQL